MENFQREVVFISKTLTPPRAPCQSHAPSGADSARSFLQLATIDFGQFADESFRLEQDGRETQLREILLSSFARLPPLNYNLMASQPAPGQRPQVQPCRYKTGKTLGAGSYSVVKECVHIDTGRYYAAKVINKRLMAGREHMVGLELSGIELPIDVQ